MSPRKRRDPAEVARQTIEKSERWRGFLNFIQLHKLSKNKESAHAYAYSLGLGVSEKVNLVDELEKKMRFDELLSRRGVDK